MLTPATSILYTHTLPEQPGARSSPSNEARERRILEALSKKGGGLSFFARTGKDVLPQATEISQIICHQYVLSYISSDAAEDGGLHRLDLRLENGAARLDIYGLPTFNAPAHQLRAFSLVSKSPGSRFFGNLPRILVDLNGSMSASV